MDEEEYKKNLDNYANEEEKGDYIMLNKKITIFQRTSQSEAHFWIFIMVLI